MSQSAGWSLFLAGVILSMPLSGSIRPSVDSPSSLRTGGTCPTREPLVNLCIVVNQKTPSTKVGFKFAYQEKIFEAACVSASDSKDEAHQKIRSMWSSFEDESDLTCSSTSFNVTHGSVLKLAVYADFRQFVFEATRIWKVNVNRVDPADGRTLLDYVRDEIARNRGTSLEANLKNYYSSLRAAGAKHASEL